MSEVAKNDDYIRYGISPLLEYDEEHEETCICKEKGVFMKNSFNFMNPMTAWDKKKIYKNYGLRLWKDLQFLYNFFIFKNRINIKVE